MTEPTPILELDNVSYSYTKGGKKVLNNISHTFRTGEVYSITGPSGAGKTTMLSLISGLTSPPTGGKVVYNGKDLAKQDRYDYRSHDIGVIFQSFNLLPQLTVAENIILSMDASGKTFDKPKKDIAVQLLEQVHLPAEYANERILHLSGGEQQRVAIARALSYDPKVVVADEPTGNLDMATQDDIMSIFRSLAHDEDRCVIIVTHSPEVAAASDEVFELAPLRRHR
ncbi:ABC transporter ATP-binding protein [Bifidobacterium sp. SO1]|uniref:ABC transporter ATP-binding protein n=1 Tax=Bifidobacterium sp. SO1 TaxID=2809029 RepID=UPI001BDD53FD|nr:ABC transporter ATP-binding protein [Bifidobacterium sp. SO1]MBT1162632.1 ABC transporter ATP-binding protein [Bifidobacterium sp. SO1]